jgi:hypothetical protein
MALRVPTASSDASKHVQMVLCTFKRAVYHCDGRRDKNAET